MNESIPFPGMPPAAITPSTPKLSADATRTAKNNALIASGRNPATGLKLIPGDSTCGECAHLIINGQGKRNWFKCASHRRGITNGPGTDIRRSWPACELFHPTGDIE